MLYGAGLFLSIHASLLVYMYVFFGKLFVVYFFKEKVINWIIKSTCRAALRAVGPSKGFGRGGEGKATASSAGFIVPGRRSYEQLSGPVFAWWREGEGHLERKAVGAPDPPPLPRRDVIGEAVGDRVLGKGKRTSGLGNFFSFIYFLWCEVWGGGRFLLCVLFRVSESESFENALIRG